MTPEIVLGILTFLGGGAVVELLRQLFARRKVNVDVESVQVQNALAVVEPLHRIIGSLEVRVGAMGVEVASLQKENSSLQVQVADLRGANLVLQNELVQAKHELGVLRRAEKTALVERTETSVKLRDAGIDVPLPSTAGDRTRRGDDPDRPPEVLE